MSAPILAQTPNQVCRSRIKCEASAFTSETFHDANVEQDTISFLDLG